MGKAAEVPADFQGATPAALLETERKWTTTSVDRNRLAMEALDARLVRAGLTDPDDPALACPFAFTAASLAQMHCQDLTIRELRCWANAKRAEYELPLIPDPVPEVATA
jgi:hypothetical protein